MRIDSRCLEFLFGDTDNKNIANLIHRDILSKLKVDGGFGLRKSEWINISLLAQQFWRILSSPPTSLLALTLQKKYIDIQSDDIVKAPYNAS